ncbi:MAG: hypothetical protein NTY45_07075 [Elusimicrobia bacterium]|nr:hypothetical protein [Elusimicrobiota bacterium]
MKAIYILAAVLLVPLVCLAAQNKNDAQGGAAKPSGGPYVIEGGHYKIDFPKGWQVSRSAVYDKAEKVFGAEAVDPRGADGVPVRISADYYTAGNLLFKSQQEYIDSNSKPAVLALPDDKFGPVKTAEVAGRRASVFEKESARLLPHGSPDAKKYPVLERTAVISAKEGFYVVKLTAPKARAAASRKLFEAALKSFRPAH